MLSYAKCRSWSALAGLFLLVTVAMPGCTTLQQFANLKNVDFSIAGVRGVRLAGIDLESIRSVEQLGVIQMAQLGTALAQKEMPLSFDLRIGASNPADNKVDARLVRFDWTLLLEDRETISGVFDQPVTLPAGQEQIIPISISFDLISFFDKNLKDLAELALSVSGQGGAPKNIKVRARPTIDTALGPIQYPNAITIVSTDVG